MAFPLNTESSPSFSNSSRRICQNHIFLSLADFTSSKWVSISQSRCHFPTLRHLIVHQIFPATQHTISVINGRKQISGNIGEIEPINGQPPAFATATPRRNWGLLRVFSSMTSTVNWVNSVRRQLKHLILRISSTSERSSKIEHGDPQGAGSVEDLLTTELVHPSPNRLQFR